MKPLKIKTNLIAQSMPTIGNTIELVVTVVFIIALVVASALFYGLFWGGHKSLFVLAVLLVVGSAVLLRRIFLPVKGLMLADILLIGVLGCYMVMIPFAATTLGAVNAALMWMALVLTYFFFADAPAQAQGWLHGGVIFAGAVIALMGLFSYAGVDMFAGQMLGDRLGGAFHYPNTTASILNMGLFAALLGNSRHRSLAMLVNACVVLCATALVLTMSRGGWMALVITIFVAFWIKRRVLLSFIAQLTIALGAGLIGSVSMMVARNYTGLSVALAFVILGGVVAGWVVSASARFVPVIALLALTAGAALGLYPMLTANRYMLFNDDSVARWRQISFRVEGLQAGEHLLLGEVAAELVPPAPIAGVVSVWDVTGSAHIRLVTHNVTSSTSITLPFQIYEGTQSIEVRLSNVHPATRVILDNPRITGLTEISLSNLFHRFLPYHLAERVSQGLQPRVLAEDGRVVFMSDGLAAIMKAPVLGYGGGAWGAVYSSVQSFFYGSGRAHADFVDFLLEIGIVGYLQLLAFFVLVLFPVVLSKTPGVHLALGGSAISLLIHSFGEATIAFPVLYFWLFAMLGSLRLGAAPLKQWGKSKKIGIYGTVLFALVVAAGVTVGTMVVAADAVAARGVSYDAARQREQATVFLRHSVRLNPWHATRKADLVLRLLEQPNTHKEQYALITSALRVAPFDPRIASLAGMLHFRDGDYVKALAYYRRTISLQPLNPATYVHAAFVAAEASLTLMPYDKTQGEYFALQVLEIHEGFLDVIFRTEPQMLRRGVVPFVEGADLRLEVGRALVLLGRVAEADSHLRAALLSKDASIQDKARVWISRVYRAGDQNRQAVTTMNSVTDKAWLDAYMARIDRALAR